MFSKKYHPDLNGSKNSCVEFRVVKDIFSTLMKDKDCDYVENIEYFEDKGFIRILNRIKHFLISSTSQSIIVSLISSFFGLFLGLVFSYFVIVPFLKFLMR